MSLSERASHFNQGESEATGEKIRLAAVYGTEDNKANAQWSKWTPSGILELHITNPEAVGKVTPGYYKVYLVPCGKDD